MITVSKSKLKAKMLEYFRTVEETGEGLVVTNHGKPVLRIEPFDKRYTPEQLFVAERGNVIYREDLLKDTSEEWPEK